MASVKRLVRRLARKCGYDIVGWYGTSRDYPADFSEEDERAVEAVRPYTMLSAEQIRVLRQAVLHVDRQGIPGDLVECGVWKGGVLKLFLDTSDRRVWGYDTFAGMTPRGPEDRLNCDKEPEWVRGLEGRDAVPMWRVWDVAPHARLIKGDVAVTLRRGPLPEQIAVLHLDTDLYESTRLELEVLWPRLSPGGILVVDDYGLWRGSRKATDEYLPDHFKVRLDETAVLVTKCSS